MKAGVKALIQSVFGRLPGGPHLYRSLTRGGMGTQSTHIDKLSRAWGGYAQTWKNLGLDLEGKDIWIHDGGWTPYPFLLNYLLTGKGGRVTMWEGSLEDQYTAKAIDFASRQTFGSLAVPTDRVERVMHLSGRSAKELMSELDGQWIRTARVKPDLPMNSVDLMVTGGVLEHFRPDDLDAFLSHSRSILRQGGWFSHVFDLRDHLYHADKSIPFLNHLKLSDNRYELFYGHPLGYHNRLLPAEILKRFEGAGYEVISVRRRILPQEVYATEGDDLPESMAGLDRGLLAPRFSQATDADLRTAALQIIGRSRA